MDKTTQLKNAISFAKQNPNSAQAIQLRRRIESGMYNQEIEQIKKQKNVFSVPETPKTFMEKIAGFTGGEKIGQGLGQALANKEIGKNIEDTQKSQFEIQGNLIKAIKDKTAMGQDTSRLENALKMINEDISNVGGGAEKLLNQKEITGKQVAGDALKLGTTLVAAGTLPGATKAVTTAKTFSQGAIQGAKTGAVAGGVFGTSSGVSEALLEDKTASEIVGSGIKGGLIGAATGAALGGVVGGATGGFKDRAIKKVAKETKFAEELVSPKLTDKVVAEAVKQGRVTEAGYLRGGKVLTGKQDKQLAEAVKGFVSSKKTKLQNVDSIFKEVGKINDRVVSYVKKNKVPFNTKQLTTQLNKGKKDLNLVFAGDKQAEKTYNAVVKELVKNVKSKDTAGLLRARQDIDKIPAIKKLLDSQALGENVKKEVVLTVRRRANEYISSLLPKGNIFKEMLLKETRMLRANSNLIDKITKGAYKGEITKSQLIKLSEKYPMMKWLVGTGLGGGIILGGAVTSSLD